MIPEKKKKMEVANEDSEDIDGELVRSTEKLQEKRAELERVSVCQKCGVAGFAELLIFCEQCQVSAEHCYCLDEFPDIDDDFTWSCEECVPRVISSLDKVIMHPTRKSERITQKRKKRWDKKCTEAEVELQQFDVAFTQQPSELQRKDVPLAPDLQQCDVAFTQQPSELRTKDVPHAPELQQCDVTFTQQPPELRAKDVPLAPVPLITDSSLQSEESRSSHICEDTNGDRKLNRKRRRLVLEDGEISDEDTEYEQVKQMQIHPDVGEAPNSMLPVEYNVDGAPNSMLPVECNVDGAPKSMLPVECNDGAAPMSMLPVECNDGDAPMSMLPVECNVGDAPMSILPVDSDVGDVAKSMLEVHSDTGDKNMLQVNTYVGNTSKSLVLSSASVGVHTYVHARPVIDPVWRGCFDISNEKYGRAVAHLTNKACLKVWEGANALSLLPLLYAEMLSRLDAWPNSFAEVAPTDDNIALYFFPESERDFENFDELVNEMIDLDLALKVFLDDAELLIFPSYQLPQQYWRFGGRYYLWGVFRGRKNPAPAKSAEPLLICDKGAECMDEARNSSVRTWRRTSPLSPLSTSSSYG